MNPGKHLTIVGAGLAGSLLAVLLARRGVSVELFERYPDPRQHKIPAGRSINLALAERGRAALAHAGLLEQVEAFALPMAGRMLHDETGQTRLQRYGQRDDEVIWSVHRGQLNQTLLNAAEAHGVTIHFDRRLSKADFDAGELHFLDSQDQPHAHDFELAIGCDGAGSALRQAMQSVTDLGVREQALGHGYLELSIPPDAAGNFRMDSKALHIWPRGGFMMIALPNPDGSFTCTLFLANDGDPGFKQLQDAATMRAFLEREFPDAVALMPDLDRELSEHPVGFLGTLYVDNWTMHDKAVLLGDAAHAIVPFHGQGMNAAFEDTVALDRLLADSPDRASALKAFQEERKPNADAIAAMALDNYLEMRDRVRDPRFHLQKALEWELEKRLPGRFIPRYAMVMFHPEIPYSQALARGERQAQLLADLTAGHEALDTIDLEKACATARERLAAA